MHEITRRSWLFGAAFWAGVSRAQQSKRFSYFDPASALEIEAIAESILPADGTPGAREAGVIWFIDRTLSVYEKDNRVVYRDGLSDLQKKRAKVFAGSSTIAGLTSEQRIALIRSIEDTEFFRLVRLHTILGFFGHPKHGGNGGLAGFKLLGMDIAMHFQPPFGYYDRDVRK